jgi:periplasmic divalent cation tolerance protein
MLLKTTRPCLRALQALVLANHPYDTAEFVVLPLDGGSTRYLDWIAASVTPPRTPARKVSDRGSS